MQKRRYKIRKYSINMAQAHRGMFGLPCKRTDELPDFRLRAADELTLLAILSFKLDVEIASFRDPARKSKL
jgi:hypothetical protein